MGRLVVATVETNDGVGPRDVVHCETCDRDVVVDVDGSPVACQIKLREKLRADVLKSENAPNKLILQGELDRLIASLPLQKECDFV